MSPLVALAAVLITAAATGLLTLILVSLRGTKSAPIIRVQAAVSQLRADARQRGSLR